MSDSDKSKKIALKALDEAIAKLAARKSKLKSIIDDRPHVDLIALHREVNQRVIDTDHSDLKQTQKMIEFMHDASRRESAIKRRIAAGKNIIKIMDEEFETAEAERQLRALQNYFVRNPRLYF